MYVLISPVKNEEHNLPLLIDTVIGQTSRPIIWIIVDDGSIDDSKSIITDAAKINNWIIYTSINRKNSEYDTDSGVAVAISHGFEYAKNQIEKRGENYKYYGILDADISLPPDYFEKLLSIAEEDEKCGVISGLIHDATYTDVCDGDPRNAARLINRRFFDELEHYPIVPAHDTVINFKAKNRGWDLIKTDRTLCYQTRPSWTGVSYWYGYKKKAEGHYYLNYYFLNAGLTGIWLLSKRPYYVGIAYLYGYFKQFLLNKPKTRDEEIRTYFHNQKNNIYRYIKNQKNK